MAIFFFLVCLHADGLNFVLNYLGMDTGGDGAGFRLVYSTRVNNVIPIAKYESTRTPLKVVIADVEGPVVNGYV